MKPKLVYSVYSGAQTKSRYQMWVLLNLRIDASSIKVIQAGYDHHGILKRNEINP